MAAVEVTRRGFLAGLAGLLVVAKMPTPVMAAASSVAPVSTASKPGFVGFDLGADLVPPPGYIYNWKRSALLGEPDVANIEHCLSQGWEFVLPAEQPDMDAVDAADAVAGGGLVLMKLTTEKAVELQAAARAKAMAQRGRIGGDW